MPTSSRVRRSVGGADLQTTISSVFDQAQNTEANHLKNIATLFKTHKRSARGATEGDSIAQEERDFQDLFFISITRILSQKKGPKQVDRIIALVGKYVAHLLERSPDLREEYLNETGKQRGDTIATRFTERLIRTLLKGVESRDKNVRYRLLQMLANITKGLVEIDEDICKRLHNALIERLDDREALCRSQAVIALCNMFQEDPLHDAHETLGVLLNLLDSDASPLVRRTILEKLPIEQAIQKDIVSARGVVSRILRRMRDIDPNVRKQVTFTLKKRINGEETDESTGIQGMGISHPRSLTSKHRKVIIKDGLRDPDASVKRAAGTLVSSWVEALSFELPKAEEKRPAYEVVILLLQLLEVISLDAEGQTQIAKDLVKCVLRERPEIYHELDFQASYWEDITPESSFLVTAFVEYTEEDGDSGTARREAALPVATSLAFKVEQQYEQLLDEQDELDSREFILQELLRLAVHLDYGDEIGRRKMAIILNKMTADRTLPEHLLPGCLDVLRCLNQIDRDFVDTAMAILREIDPLTGEAPPPLQSLPENQQMAALKLQKRCLLICNGTLERMVVTIDHPRRVQELMRRVMAALDSRASIILEQGLAGMTLIALMCKSSAWGVLAALMRHADHAIGTIQEVAFKGLFDILVMYSQTDFWETEADKHRIHSYIFSRLGNVNETTELKTILIKGLIILTLTRSITVETALQKLLQAHFTTPLDEKYKEMRFYLASFFEGYPKSGPANQLEIRLSFLDLFKYLSDARHTTPEIVPPLTICQMFISWTDPDALPEDKRRQGDEAIVLDLTHDLVKAIFDVDLSRDEKKALCQSLGHIRLPVEADDDKVHAINLLIKIVHERHVLKCKTSRAALSKFEVNFGKKYSKQLEDFSEEDLRKLESFTDLFAFLDDIEDAGEEDGEFDIDRRLLKRERSSDSLFTTTDEETSRASTSVANRSSRSRGKASKRPRVSTDASGSEYGSGRHSVKRESTTPEPRPQPLRKQRPQRAAAIAAGAKNAPIEISSDEDEVPSAPPSVKKRAPKASTSTASTSRRASSTYEDPIIIKSDDDSEGEVNDLLGAD